MIRMPSVGDSFVRYDLLRVLGHGGMGVVYAARDTALDREVALKIITPQLAADEDYRARFRREAQALSRVESPHVVAVHDHGELDGCLHLVTALVPDGDLLVMCAGGVRSAMTCSLLERAGHRVVNLHGGMHGWQLFHQRLASSRG